MPSHSPTNPDQRVLQAVGMIAATVRIAVTQGLLTAHSRKVPRAADSSNDALEGTGAAPGRGPFASTAVPDIAALQPVFKHTSRGSEVAQSLPKAVSDISRTTIDVNSSRVGQLTTLLPQNGRPLATSFVQSVLFSSTCPVMSLDSMFPDYTCTCFSWMHSSSFMLTHRSACPGLGLSVDEGDRYKSKQPQSCPAEYEIRGEDEQVLKDNMEQLNVSAGCMLVLCISTCLLAEATELPAVVLHLGSLQELVEHAPALLNLCVDFSEQVGLEALTVPALTIVPQQTLHHFQMVLSVVAAHFYSAPVYYTWCLVVSQSGHRGMFQALEST